MIFIFVANRVARHLLFKHRFQIFAITFVNVKADHIGARNHNFPDAQFGEVENIIDKIYFRFVNQSLFPALLHQQANFFRVVCNIAFSALFDTKIFRDEVCRDIQHGDERIHDFPKNQHGQSDRQQNFFRIDYRHRLRRKLTQNYMHCGNQRKRQRE